MRRIHRETSTTIVFVTHDMDEALGLATRIALIDRGRLAQEGTPVEILTRPANELVRSFVGADDAGLRLLSVVSAGQRMRPGETAPGTPIAAGLSLRAALAEMIARQADRLPVADAEGRPAGVLHLADLVRPAP
jgi:osmoprotectant transport system ATP-binding protein